MKKLTHFDQRGQAHMVDVGGKNETHRIARASGRIVMLRTTLAMITAGTAKKGDVLSIARIAAIQGAKRTADRDGDRVHERAVEQPASVDGDGTENAR